MLARDDETESKVWLLDAPNSNRQDWWKGKFVLFWMLATDGGESGVGGLLPKGCHPYIPHLVPSNQWARAFMDRGKGL